MEGLEITQHLSASSARKKKEETTDSREMRQNKRAQPRPSPQLRRGEPLPVAPPGHPPAADPLLAGFAGSAQAGGFIHQHTRAQFFLEELFVPLIVF